MKQITRTKLSESVARAIVEEIQKGSYPPGTRLPTEHEFMEKLRVGRSSVREAFQSLVMMGILDTRAGQGTFVRDISRDVIISPYLLAPLVDPNSASDFMEARLVVEPSIAGIAAVRHSDEQYREMENMLNECDSCIQSGQSVTAINGEFHLKIAMATGNIVFVRFMEAIIRMLVRRGEVLESDRSYQEWELESHREILSAIGSRLDENARRAMEDHIIKVTGYHKNFSGPGG
ncbi:MAG: FadR/GntR family transcriptional regulator [Spirochaetota bacterium]